MIKNKILTTILAIVVLSLKAMAINSNFKNSLDEIYVKKTSGGTYAVSFLFDKEYTEPLSLQKKSKNSYSIILPETKLSSKNIKILYKEGQSPVKLEVQEHPYLDQNINNGYVKIIATVKDNVKLNVSTDISPVKTASAKQVKKQIEQTKTLTQIPKKETKKEQSKTTAPEPIKPTENIENKQKAPTKEDLEIMSGLTSVEQELEDQTTSDIEDKSSLNKDYVDIMMKLSLGLFLILLITRQLYKKYKVRQQRLTERKELQQNYKKRLFNHEDEIENADVLSQIYPEVKKQSEFQKQVDTMAQNQKPQPQRPQSQPIQEQKPQQTIDVVSSTDEEFLDENFDYEIVEDPNDIDDNSAPKLISKAEIDTNKGFYLIQYEGEIALVGYIKDNVFVLNKFSRIFKPNLQARLNERQELCSNYLVRVDGYKALVQVSATSMKVLIEF